MSFSVESILLILPNSSYCIKEGIVIYRYYEYNITKYCYDRKTCATGHLLNGVCSHDCLCPEWAFKCTRYTKNDSSIDDSHTMLEFDKAVVCSYTPNKRCTEKPVIETFPQILLDSNASYIIK